MVEIEEIKERPKEFIPAWWDGINKIQSPLILLGPEARITAINESACKVLGYASIELKLKSLLDITHKDDQVNEVNNYIDLFYSSKQSNKTSKKFISKEGKDIHVVQHTYSLPDEESGIQYALIVFIPKEQNMVSADKKDKAQSKLDKLSGLTNMLDVEEFGSSFNKEIINQIRSNVKALIELMEISDTA